MINKNSKLEIAICILYFPLFIACKASPSVSLGTKTPASEIVKKIIKGEQIHYKDITIAGDIDFTSIVDEQPESGGLFRSTINSPITFLNCTFEGKVTAFRVDENRNSHCVRFSQNLSFLNSQFKEDVNFREVFVVGICSFSSSVFYKEASFNSAYFLYKDTYFSNTLFKDKAKFQRVVFNGNAHFLKSEFNKSAIFQKVKFNSIAQFGAAKFMAYADFSNTHAQKGYIFNYARFASKAMFSNSVIFDRFDMNDCLFEDLLSGKNSNFYCVLELQRANAKASIDLTNATFLKGYPDATELKLNADSEIILEGAQVSVMKEVNKNDFIK